MTRPLFQRLHADDNVARALAISPLYAALRNLLIGGRHLNPVNIGPFVVQMFVLYAIFKRGANVLIVQPNFKFLSHWLTFGYRFPSG